MGKIATDFLNEWNKSLKIKRAVLEAHKEGSFGGNCGNVEIDNEDGEIHVTMFPDSSSYQQGCTTIFSNHNHNWEEGLELVMVDGMYIFEKDELNNSTIFEKDELNNSNAGRKATSIEAEESGLKGELMALTEHEAYEEVDWSVVLDEAIDEVIERDSKMQFHLTYHDRPKYEKGEQDGGLISQDSAKMKEDN